ncbi:type II secretion system F family protein [Brevibacterium album]|uniref:type II secretion system F family protein n=1 Tax=Brevibacterium album TaxID=417948 RepID=UPI0004126C6A|nr:type II secretion system F family protein [Brevibacterium album]
MSAAALALICALVCAGLLLTAAGGPRARLRRILPRGEGGAAPTAEDAGGSERGRGAAGRSASAGTSADVFAPAGREAGELRLPAHLTGPDDPARAITVIDRAAELLRIGLPPAEALAQLAELSDPEIAQMLLRAARSLSLGDDPRTAIARHARTLPPPVAEVLTGMGAVWFVSETAGAPAADMLERFAASRREIADAERERAVSLAGPRATVTVLTWLPAAGLGLALLIGADPLALLSSGLGLASLLSGGTLLVAGRLWMTALLRRAQ